MADSKKADKDGGGYSPLVVYPLMNVIFLSIGLAIAQFQVHPRLPAASLAALEYIAENEYGYLYLAIFSVYIVHTVLNINAGHRRKCAKIENPNQHVYKILKAPEDRLGSYVLMADEGVQGEFNRAQRSVANLVEYLPLYLAELIAVGFVFPRGAFYVAVVFGVGRIISGLGYTKSAGGRSFGFLIQMIALFVMHGAVLLIALSTLGHIDL